MDTDEQIETVSTDITGASTIRKPKETHCKFCALNFYNGSDLDAHLRTKTKCRVQYMKVFKASSFDDLSKRLYNCEMCKDIQRIDFKRHLERNLRCLLYYRRKYGEEDIEAIYKKVKNRNDQRKSYPSYNAKKYQRKDDELKTKTEVKEPNQVQSPNHSDLIILPNLI